MEADCMYTKQNSLPLCMKVRNHYALEEGMPLKSKYRDIAAHCFYQFLCEDFLLLERVTSQIG